MSLLGFDGGNESGGQAVSGRPKERIGARSSGRSVRVVGHEQADLIVTEWLAGLQRNPRFHEVHNGFGRLSAAEGFWKGKEWFEITG